MSSAISGLYSCSNPVVFFPVLDLLFCVVENFQVKVCFFYVFSSFLNVVCLVCLIFYFIFYFFVFTDLSSVIQGISHKVLPLAPLIVWGIRTSKLLVQGDVDCFHIHFLVNILSFLRDIIHLKKNFFFFTYKINQLQIDLLFVTMDIVSSCSNIRHKENILACENIFTWQLFPECVFDHICDAIWFILIYNNYE